jgi:hypothetical protein
LNASGRVKVTRRTPSLVSTRTWLLVAVMAAT